MAKRGKLYIISAPSGSGKTTLIKDILNRLNTLSFSISHTTRAQRKDEQNMIDYFFISKKEFKKKIKNGHWLEWAKVHENYYGTSKEFVTTTLNSGKSLILDIDIQGALQIMKFDLDRVTIFIMPPSIEVLLQRLKSRGTDSKKVIETRLENAKGEMARKDLYQYVIVNDDLEQAKKELYMIFKKEMA
jgi:guanylate kinase